MSEECHVYVFGPFGGPYKIGRTCDLRARTLALQNGYAFCLSAAELKRSVIWYSMAFEDQAEAKGVEFTCHHWLDAFRIVPATQAHRRKFYEWFRVDLNKAIRTVNSTASSRLRVNHQW